MRNDLTYEQILKALQTLKMPVFMSLKELKSHYRNLAKENHPDKKGNILQMSNINEAYEILKTYMENYRFSFSKEEILKQLPQEDHAVRFKF